VGRYYYAGGRKIALEEDGEHVGIDTARAPTDPAVSRASSAWRLPGGILVVPTSSLEASDIVRLKASGALRPAFRPAVLPRVGPDQTLLIPLPEVRVEVDDEPQRDAVRRALKTWRHKVVVSSSSSERVVLVPASGDPMDALDLANAIHERAHPAAASVRFVQVVKRRANKP